MKNKAVTLVYLMVLVVLTVIIVVSIGYIVIAYLSIPPESNESEAIGNLRVVVGAQAAFKSVEGGYASTWKELHDDPVAAKKPVYLDLDLSVLYQGYNFTLSSSGDSLTGSNGKTVYTDFTCKAIPAKYDKGNKRSFFVDSTGVIRFEYGKTATLNSEPI